MGRSGRPEHTAPPDIFYNEEEAQKYTNNTRMINIQTKLTERALELLALPDDGQPRMLLDIGCGSGLSGEALTERGHMWVGLDISPSMLDVAVEREVEGDVILGDMGCGLPLRPGMFDAAISISAVQWLCNADTSTADPKRRMRRFFETLYACLAKGARAVLQIYPENPQQAEMLTLSAMRAGFSGGMVVDYPHSTRAKKYFLVLMVGGTTAVPAARGTDAMDMSDAEEDDMYAHQSDGDGQTDGVKVVGRHRRGKKRKVITTGSGSARHPEAKGKDWIFKKKDQMRHKGYTNIPGDSKYTGRKRKSARF